MTPAEARAELVLRLTNGSYTQGQYTLKAVHQDTGETRHCCLGVGGEIAVEEGICEWVPFVGEPSSVEATDLQDDGWELFALRSIGTRTETPDVLTDAARRFFGLRKSDGAYQTDLFDAHRSLALDNDSGIPFDQIAERIANDESLLS